MKAILRGIFIVLGIMFGFGFLGIISLIGFLWLMQPNPWDDRPFDKKVWLSFFKSEDFNNPRGQMFSDLKKSYLKIGMTKSDVLHLLGEPDFGKSESTFKYMLGAWSGFRIDYDSLDIEFTPSGTVQKFNRTQH